MRAWLTDAEQDALALLPVFARRRPARHWVTEWHPEQIERMRLAGDAPRLSEPYDPALMPF